MPEKVENVEEKEVFDAFRKQLAENKPKKGKGKKGGKKKKKKGWSTKFTQTILTLLISSLKTNARRLYYRRSRLKLKATFRKTAKSKACQKNSSQSFFTLYLKHQAGCRTTTTGWEFGWLANERWVSTLILLWQLCLQALPTHTSFFGASRCPPPYRLIRRWGGANDESNEQTGERAILCYARKGRRSPVSCAEARWCSFNLMTTPTPFAAISLLIIIMDYSLSDMYDIFYSALLITLPPFPFYHSHYYP